MRRIAAFWLGLLLCAGPAAAAPRLLVVVSVDQMRADYLTRSDVSYSGGLKTLFESGAVWSNANHAHIPTQTGPGHAMILTGRYPDRTGIVGNKWWDRLSGAGVYCVDDPVHGLGAGNLLSYTVGDALKAKAPASRVVAVSMKDRAAILMGGKKADAAIWYDDKKGEFTSSSYYGARPDWLGPFNAKLKEKGGALASGKYKDILETPDADSILLDLAERAVQEYRLGEKVGPDILAVSFSATDYIGHSYGPDSPQMKKQLSHLDGVLGEFLGFLKVQVGAENFDLVLTADHGVLPVPEEAAGKALHAERLLAGRFEADLEKALQALHPAPGKRWLSAAFFPNIYLDSALAKSMGLDWRDLLRGAAKAAARVDGMAAAYIPGDWDESDPFTPVYRRSWYPGRSGDLVLRQKEGVLIDDDSKTGTSHNSPYPYDTHVPLVFLGPDFRTGLYGVSVPVADLAPTLGRVLDVDYPPAEGARVLKECLTHP